jgi:hypothetical protein
MNFWLWLSYCLPWRLHGRVTAPMTLGALESERPVAACATPSLASAGDVEPP